MSSWSAALKWMRLGSPVVPEVGRVTIRSTSPAGYAQQSHALPPDVVGGREGQPRDVVERDDVTRLHGGQSVGVETAAVAGAGDRLAQGAQLVPAQPLHVGRTGTTQNPGFQRRAFEHRAAEAHRFARSSDRDPPRSGRRPTPSPRPSAAVRL